MAAPARASMKSCDVMVDFLFRAKLEPIIICRMVVESVQILNLRFDSVFVSVFSDIVIPDGNKVVVEISTRQVWN